MRCIILFVYFLKIKTPHSGKILKSIYSSLMFDTLLLSGTVIRRISPRSLKIPDRSQIFNNLSIIAVFDAFSMHCCTKAVIVEKFVVFCRWSIGQKSQKSFFDRSIRKGTWKGKRKRINFKSTGMTITPLKKKHAKIYFVAPILVLLICQIHSTKT